MSEHLWDLAFMLLGAYLGGTFVAVWFLGRQDGIDHERSGYGTIRRVK